MNRRAIIKAPVLIAGAVVLPKTVLAKDEERLKVIDRDAGLIRGVVLRRGETWPGDDPITIADDCEFDLSELGNCFVHRNPASMMMDIVGHAVEYQDDGRCVWLTSKVHTDERLLYNHRMLLALIDANLLKYNPGITVSSDAFFGPVTLHKARFHNVALDRVR